LRENIAATLLVRIYDIVRLRPMRSGYSPQVIPPSRLWRAFSMRRVACILLSVTIRVAVYAETSLSGGLLATRILRYTTC